MAETKSVTNLIRGEVCSIAQVFRLSTAFDVSIIVKRVVTFKERKVRHLQDEKRNVIKNNSK